MNEIEAGNKRNDRQTARQTKGAKTKDEKRIEKQQERTNDERTTKTIDTNTQRTHWN